MSQRGVLGRRNAKIIVSWGVKMPKLIVSQGGRGAFYIMSKGDYYIANLLS